MPDLVPLSGSERSELPGATPASAPLDDSQVITVTVLLRRRARGLPRGACRRARKRSAPPNSVTATAPTPTTRSLSPRCSASTGWSVTEYHLPSRRLKVSGTIGAMQSAFGTTLTAVSPPHPDGSGDIPAPVQDRRAVGARPAFRDRHRGGRARRPAGGTPAVPPRPGVRRADHRGALEDEKNRRPRRLKGWLICGPRGRSPALTSSRRAPTAPGRPSSRSSNWAAVTCSPTCRPTSPRWGSRGAVGDRGGRRDGEVQLAGPGRRRRGRAGHPGGRRRRAGRGAGGLLSRLTPTRDSSTRSPMPRTPRPDTIAISISWGQSEDQWSQQSRNAMNSGVCLCCCARRDRHGRGRRQRRERRPIRPDVGARRLPRLVTERARLRRDQARREHHVVFPRSLPRWCGTSGPTTRAPWRRRDFRRVPAALLDRSSPPGCRPLLPAAA